MRVRTLATVTTPAGEISAGELITIPDAVYERLRGKVEIVTDTHRECVTCRIAGDVCLIVYPPELYQQHHHRDGEQIEVDGQTFTLRIVNAVNLAAGGDRNNDRSRAKAVAENGTQCFSGVQPTPTWMGAKRTRLSPTPAVWPLTT
jgi:hypothetical protein